MVKDEILAYDQAYRPTSAKTTLPTNPTLLGSLSGTTYSSTAAYDKVGHLVTAGLPAIGGLAAENVQTGYSPTSGYNGAPAMPTTLGIGSAGAANIITGNTWTGSGLLNTRTYASTAGSPLTRGVVWDPVRRAPSEVLAYYGAGPTYLQKDAYERDGGGNVTAIIDRGPVSGLANGQAQCFLYDGRNRLTDAWTFTATSTASACPTVAPADSSNVWNVGVTPYRSAWAPATSGNGNLDSASTYAISGATAVKTTRAYAYDTANNHPNAVASITPSTAGTTGSDAFAYDAAGRQNSRSVNGAAATSMAWNPASDLTSTVKSSATTRYIYDAGGQRVLKITPTAVTAYLGGDEATAPLPSGAAVATRRYTQAGTLVASRVGSGGLVFQLADIQGSASVQVGSGDPSTATVKRQRYLPYGGPRGATNQIDINQGWLGQTQDDATNESGLTYLNARYYDPASSVFISADPLVTPVATATLNPYAYALSSPEAMSDPSGLAPICELEGSCHAKRDAATGAIDMTHRKPDRTNKNVDARSDGGTPVTPDDVAAHIDNLLRGDSKAESLLLYTTDANGNLVENAAEWAALFQAEVVLQDYIAKGQLVRDGSNWKWAPDGKHISTMAYLALVPAFMNNPIYGFMGGKDGGGVARIGGAKDAAKPAAKAADDVAPPIKVGSAGGDTAGKAFPGTVRDQALAENPNTCVYCRMTTNSPQVDHAIPRVRGGDATLKNAQTTCGFCNASKGGRDFPVNPPPGFRGEFPPAWWTP